MKMRLDLLLTERGLAPTRTKAQAMILGNMVKVNGEVVSKPSEKVDSNAQIICEPLKYISRGGIKLEGALQYFQMDVKNLEVLDVGASTGGFTDCLLQFGAKHVYAIDVGKDQLDPSLRSDPRVTFLESFHVKDLTPTTFNRIFPLAVIDVSFISLKKVLPYVVPCLEPQGKILALIKPQFETQPPFLDQGVVKDPLHRQKLVAEICRFASEDLQLQNIQTFDATIQGPAGNQETFLYCSVRRSLFAPP